MTTINPNFLPSNFYDTSGNLTVSQDEAARVSGLVESKVAQMPPAERELFLLMLQGADLAPNGTVPADLGATLDRMEAAAAALNRLADMGSNSIDLLARLMVEQAGQQRKDALAERLAAREQAKSDLMDQASKMKEAADKLVSGALQNMIISIVTSLASAALSVVSAAKATQGLSSAKDAKGLTDGAQQAKLGVAGGHNALGQAWGGGSQAVGTLGGGIGNYAQTLEQSDSKKLEAEGSMKAAEAQYAQGQADIKKEMQDALNQMIQSIINFIKEMKEAEVNMMQAITRG